MLLHIVIGPIIVYHDYKVGDMILNEYQFQGMNSETDDEALEFARKEPHFKWPKNEMPYVIDESTIPQGSNERKLLEDTILELNKDLNGCFQFRYVITVFSSRIHRIKLLLLAT